MDTTAKFQVPKGFFGAAGSPLVDGDRVLMNIGGAGAGLVAFDAATGKTLWTATNHQASYSAPVLATINGARHALFFTRAGLVDADPATGKVRFEFPWRARMQASVNAAAPIVVDDMVFLSASYGTGAVLLQIGPGGPKQVWASDDSLPMPALWRVALASGGLGSLRPRYAQEAPKGEAAKSVSHAG